MFYLYDNRDDMKFDGTSALTLAQANGLQGKTVIYYYTLYIIIIFIIFRSYSALLNFPFPPSPPIFFFFLDFLSHSTEGREGEGVNGCVVFSCLLG